MTRSFLHLSHPMTTGATDTTSHQFGYARKVSEAPQDKPDESHKSRGEPDGPPLPSFLALDQRYLGHIISHPETGYSSG